MTDSIKPDIRNGGTITEATQGRGTTGYSSITQVHDHEHDHDDTPNPEAHHKKQLATKGLLGMSIITNNVAQLKTLVFANRYVNYPLWITLVIMVMLSLSIQLLVAAILAYVSSIEVFQHHAEKEKEKCLLKDADSESSKLLIEKIRKKNKQRHRAALLTDIVAFLATLITVLNLVVTALQWNNEPQVATASTDRHS